MVAADLSFHLVSDLSACLYSDLVFDLAFVDLYSDPDFGLDSADFVDLSTFSVQEPNCTGFHDRQDYYAVTFYRRPQPLHNLYQLGKVLPYCGRYGRASFYAFQFCWPIRIVPWHPETFAVAKEYFPNCT